MADLPDPFQQHLDAMIASGAAAKMLRADGTDDIFEADPLGVAEKITGKSYKEEKPEEGMGETSALGFMLMHARAQLWEKQAKKTKDTWFNMNMDEYLAVVESLGFKKILEVPFFDTGYRGDEEPLAQMQYHYWRDGLLLVTDTYGWRSKSEEKRTRNRACIYCNLIPKSLEHNIFEVPHLSGGFEAVDAEVHKLPHKEKWQKWDELWDRPDRYDHFVFPAHFDAREGLRKQISAVERECIILPKWKVQGLLWLCHYEDEHKIKRQEDTVATNKFDFSKNLHDEITEQRIALYPPEIQEAVNSCRKRHETT